ncbi:flowering-promoting factor 1-like protein 5 [Lolium rigidum]|uniref:flowering-promoting factor 1-like protein 5 n=1 Tax=Lolium rigidum TaxID=89674 RepID=UPI001F5D076E|nr:flowering-promoting factor 1-like protein 5 [Lolium rigidum]
MSAGGVWVFKNGTMELDHEAGTTKKALVYVPANETIRTLEMLERRLGSLGWERYYEDLAVVQLHKRDGSIDLISVPRDFSRLRSTHMYDIVVKNRGQFKVVDVQASGSTSSSTN